MSDLPKNHDESEDLFDFPEVEGFSAEFIEAARQQTEAASATAPETGPSFKDQGDDTFEDFNAYATAEQFREMLRSGVTAAHITPRSIGPV